ncbi:hypothetical protein FHG87_018359 [Trinorchestia longiramus]|nr:hypothetical protein FHG87_018359 [Trinorchestia longiramus]
MWIPKEKERHGLLLAALLLSTVLVLQVHGLTEEIEATPTNTNGIEVGELSMPQYILLMLIFLKYTLLYAVGVLPLEIDLGGIWDPDSATTLNGDDQPLDVRRSLDNHYAELDHKLTKESILSSMWDCPLQFVCEVDQWANRDHDYLIESLIAKWFRNPNNNTFHSAQGKVYGGLPDTCSEMYPCPFDIQEIVGIRIPGSSTSNKVDVDDPNPDAYMSLS